MARPELTERQHAILDTFDYHRPTAEQGDRIGMLRAAFKRCANAVMAHAPEGADQTAALRQLHEAMMTANKAVACEPGTPRVVVGDLEHECPRPPPGWSCTRGAGHTGPCAAVQDVEPDIKADDDPNPGV